MDKIPEDVIRHIASYLYDYEQLIFSMVNLLHRNILPTKLPHIVSLLTYNNAPSHIITWAKKTFARTGVSQIEKLVLLVKTPVSDLIKRNIASMIKQAMLIGWYQLVYDAYVSGITEFDHYSTIEELATHKDRRLMVAYKEFIIYTVDNDLPYITKKMLLPPILFAHNRYAEIMRLTSYYRNTYTTLQHLVQEYPKCTDDNAFIAYAGWLCDRPLSSHDHSTISEELLLDSIRLYHPLASILLHQGCYNISRVAWERIIKQVIRFGNEALYVQLTGNGSYLRISSGISTNWIYNIAIKYNCVWGLERFKPIFTARTITMTMSCGYIRILKKHFSGEEGIWLTPKQLLRINHNANRVIKFLFDEEYDLTSVFEANRILKLLSIDVILIAIKLGYNVRHLLTNPLHDAGDVEKYRYIWSSPTFMTLEIFMSLRLNPNFTFADLQLMMNLIPSI